MTDHRAITIEALEATKEEFQREMSELDCTEERAAILARGVFECVVLRQVLMDLADDAIETRRLQREHAEFMEQDQQEEWDRATYGDAA